MKVNLQSLLFILITISFSDVYSASSIATYDVRNYGAIGDGVKLNTTAIQSAIDSCSSNGGGTVFFAPNNVFLTGTIEIKNNVTFHLDGNARIVGSDYLKDYRDDVGGSPYGEGIDRALLFADGAYNIKLTGTGCIDGGNRGKKNTPEECAHLLNEKQEKMHNRPVAIRLRNCNRVRMSNLLFTNSRSWFTYLQFCTDVAITGITIDNPYQDGFNIESCQDVRISDCSIDCYDDAFALTTSHPDKPIRNFTITNCTVKSHWAAIRFGPLSKGDFENVMFNNMVLHDCEGGGIKIDPCEGGEVRNCIFSNIRMEDVNGPICIQSARWPNIGAGGWNEKGRKLMPASPIKNLIFSNMIIKAAGRPSNDPNHNPIIWIHGHPEALAQNITLDNIQIIVPGEGTTTHAERRDMKDVDEIKWDESGYWYTNKSAFGVPPSYGLFARNVSQLKIRNVVFQTKKKDERPAIFLYECSDCELDGVTAEIEKEAKSMLVLKQSKNIYLKDLRVKGEAEFILQLEDSDPSFVVLEKPHPFSSHSKKINNL